MHTVFAYNFFFFFNLAHTKFYTYGTAHISNKADYKVFQQQMFGEYVIFSGLVLFTGLPDFEHPSNNENLTNNGMS